MEVHGNTLTATASPSRLVAEGFVERAGDSLFITPKGAGLVHEMQKRALSHAVKEIEWFDWMAERTDYTADEIGLLFGAAIQEGSAARVSFRFPNDGQHRLPRAIVEFDSSQVAAMPDPRQAP